MARKRHTAEEIVTKLRQVDVLVAQGQRWSRFLNRFSASISGASTGFRLPSGGAAS